MKIKPGKKKIRLEPAGFEPMTPAIQVERSNQLGCQAQPGAGHLQFTNRDDLSSVISSFCWIYLYQENNGKIRGNQGRLSTAAPTGTITPPSKKGLVNWAVSVHLR